jgi:hypothetical protein
MQAYGGVEEGNKWPVSGFVTSYFGQSAAGTHCVGGWLVYTEFVNFADKAKITPANNCQKTMFTTSIKFSFFIFCLLYLCFCGVTRKHKYNRHLELL